MSKTFIRKNRKGMANYWLYKQLHQKRSLGSLYYINYLFLIALAAFTIVFIFSWLKWMQIPIIVVAIILGLIEIPATFKALICINRYEAGKAFVIFRAVKGYNGKIAHFATPLDWLYCVFPLGMYLFLIMQLFL